VQRSFPQLEAPMTDTYDPLAHVSDPNDRFQVFASTRGAEIVVEIFGLLPDVRGTDRRRRRWRFWPRAASPSTVRAQSSSGIPNCQRAQL
jgi:hypothetical protein